MKTYTCILSTNSYLPGVLLLNENLKRLESKYDLLCLINENISSESKEILDKFNIKYKEFKNVKYNVNFKCNWNNTFDKFNVFLLEEYEKIVCLDVDLLILENIDFLFDYDTPAMAVNNQLFEDKFNSGVMVIKPDKDVYKKLLRMKEQESLYNKVIGDQNILNDYYLNESTINRIPDRYNIIRMITKDKELVNGQEKYKVTKNTSIENPAVLHYVGTNKPFLIDGEFNDEYNDIYQEYLNTIKEQLNNKE